MHQTRSSGADIRVDEDRESCQCGTRCILLFIDSLAHPLNTTTVSLRLITTHRDTLKAYTKQMLLRRNCAFRADGNVSPAFAGISCKTTR
jgi:hypothetical protein